MADLGPASGMIYRRTSDGVPIRQIDSYPSGGSLPGTLPGETLRQLEGE